MRVKLLALLSAATLFVLAAVPASAASKGIGYPGLGDSVPFGYSPLLNPTVGSNFVGYPEIAARLLNTQDVNATCPGEATGGFHLPYGHRQRVPSILGHLATSRVLL